VGVCRVRVLVMVMVGVVEWWVWGVVCLVGVCGLEGVECVFVACEEGGIVESGLLGFRGVGDLGL
jgi:hypothetical protein